MENEKDLYDEIYYKIKRQDIATVLESLIDRHTLKNILWDLSNVCYEKANHTLANWQNKSLSRKWTHLGSTFDQLSSKLESYI